jgi:hypothetical protein
MSETDKKKPSFNDLDLSKLSSKPIEEPAPTEAKQEKPKVKDGIWIYGKSIEIIEAEEFKSWLDDIVPGHGLDNSKLSTSKDRERIVNRLIFAFNSLFGTIPEDKKYIN